MINIDERTITIITIVLAIYVLFKYTDMYTYDKISMYELVLAFMAIALQIILLTKIMEL